MTFGNPALALLAVVSMCLEADAAQNRPNIVVIITDQQSATMMSCAGNKWLKTPAMDSLAATHLTLEYILHLLHRVYGTPLFVARETMSVKSQR